MISDNHSGGKSTNSVTRRIAIGVAGTLMSLMSCFSYAENCSSMPVSGKAYTIVNAGSGLTLDVSRKDMKDGADVIQWNSTGGTNQQWTLTDLGNGTWSIRPVHSNKSLDVYNWSSTNRSAIKQWSHTGNDNQRWVLKETEDGGFKIVSSFSKLPLAVEDGNKNTKVMQLNDSTSAFQRWYFNPVDGICADGGCGASPKFNEGKNTLVSDGTTREFWVHLPTNYNSNKPLPLVVGLHWRGGQATNVYGTDNAAFYGLHELYGEAAIFVAPNGLDQGWANYNDRDIHFVHSMVDQLKKGLCIDSKRVYATGFSFGGMMSNAIGCQMGDTFRAVAPMSGALWSGCADSTNKVAAIFTHSKDDPVVPYKNGEEARDKFLTKNGCTNATSRVGKNGCVEYQGCSADYPVMWCGPETGGHWPPGFAAREIKAFFDRF